MTDRVERSEPERRDTAAGVPGDEPRSAAARRPRPKEIGGADGPEPTRYGDWEHNGRCTDF